ncbi:MAG: acetyl-CoA hydrolase [Lachnospiraceae bacterium]|nr:acetyl-CoA hydrolase [Lachnospiraceae bacterium]
MKERVASAQLQNRIVSAQEAARHIKDGMTVAFAGYTNCGYPKVIAKELVARKQAGENLRFRYLAGAAIAPLDTMFAAENMVLWRAPLQESRELSKQINSGSVSYAEQQMVKLPRLVRDGAYGEIDVAVVEAIAITKDNGLVPTASVGMVPYFLEKAKGIIIEVNTALPDALNGMHDIFMPGFGSSRRVIPLTDVGERIGTPWIPFDPEKVLAVVQSDIPDETPLPAEAKEEQVRAVNHLISFLEQEVEKMPDGVLPPVQTGFGAMASEIVRGLQRSGLRDIRFFCGNMQEANVELMKTDQGKAATCGAIQLTPKVMQMMRETPELFRKKIVLRNTDITNGAEVCSRLGLVTLNSGIEMDIYGNVNSSHVSGTRVVNGLGGGASFAENAGLSVMLLVSENKGGKISTIVPMVPHQDICEHDIDVVVTENGVADLRGLDDTGRARAIISHCAGPHYRDALADYLDCASSLGGHHPQILEEAFSWHIRLKETGSMQLSS